MPKGRKKSGSRNVAKKLFIICEGAAHKSEPAYFEALKKDLTFAGDKIDIEIVNTKYNTGKELVKVAKQKLFDGFKDIDEAWIVYDKDGYTKHAETFDTASAKKNAKQLRLYAQKGNPVGTPVYEMNPYTNIDELVEQIENLAERK